MGKPVLLLFLAAASYTDLKFRYIDNFQNIYFSIMGLLFITLERGVYGLFDGVVTAIAVFSVSLIFYAAGFIGAGDIKFIMGIAAYLGHEILIASLIPITIAAVAIMIFMALKEREIKGLKIPMAIPISLGIIWQAVLV